MSQEAREWVNLAVVLIICAIWYWYGKGRK